MILIFLMGVYLGGSLLVVLYWMIEYKENTKDDNRKRLELMIFWPIVTIVIFVSRAIQAYRDRK